MNKVTLEYEYPYALLIRRTQLLKFIARLG